MTDEILHYINDTNEMVCESCSQHFHYDRRRHCWKCDALTCPHCTTIDNLCPECITQTLPAHIEPMLAQSGKIPVDPANWAFEFKWDGIRALTYWDGHRLTIQSRNQIDITFRYPELRDIGVHLKDNAVLDGEIIAMDSTNRPSFTLLQKRMHLTPAKVTGSVSRVRIYYYIFDLLYLNGRNLMHEPYHQRRRALEDLHIHHAACRIPPSYQGEPKTIQSVVRQFDLEGMIAKKLTSEYVPGVRTDNWIKIKRVKSREFIIGGFKYADNTTNRIGSLQLGAYDEHMNLRYVGSTGSGFSDEDHTFLLSVLEPAKISQSPFTEKPDEKSNFTKPVYIAQIEYRRWPKNGLIQQSVFKGLRMDKFPADIKLKED